MHNNGVFDGTDITRWTVHAVSFDSFQKSLHTHKKSPIHTRLTTHLERLVARNVYIYKSVCQLQCTSKHAYLLYRAIALIST